jgi:hypothetical protein
MVQNFTSNVGNGKGTKSRSLMGIKSLNGTDQSEITDLFQIFVGFDTLTTEAIGNLANQSRV